jgi:hypothetical protein
MKAIEFIRDSVSALHGELVKDVKILTKEQLAWKPAPGTNPIGFLFWHTTRTEDNVIQGFRKQSSIWESENWQQKSGLDYGGQGTGFDETEVERVSTLPLDGMIAYGERVIQGTEDYLAILDDNGLDQTPNPDRPQRTIAAGLSSLILGHGWWHLGEIKFLKGMQGMPFGR